MVTDKLVLSVQMFLLSVYITYWYGGILPSFVEIGIIDYVFIGISGSILLIAAAAVLFISGNRGIVIRSAVLFVHIILLFSLLIPTLSDYLYALLLIAMALLQGIMIGFILKRCIGYSLLRHTMSFLILGTAGIWIAQYLPFKLIAGKAAASSLSEATWNNITLMSILTLILIFFGILDVRFKIESEKSYNDSTLVSPFSKIVKYTAITNAAILVLIELIFCFWSVVLLDANQSIFNSLTFPASIVVLFILSVFLKSIGRKMTNSGWLFTHSVILTVSLGLFYTFNITLLFILGFGFSASYLVYINNYIFSINTDTKNIAFLLLVGSAMMVIVGFYTQNHIEFIRSINIPEGVITLSARQALVKELASFAAVSVIISGYLFLNRRAISTSSQASK